MNNMFIKDLRINWEDISERSYIRAIPSIASIDELVFEEPVTYFVGENGSGKSTLLEAIAIAYGFNPEGGTKNYAFSTYDSHSDLCHAIRLSKGYLKPKWGYFLRAESFYNVATKEDEYSRGPGGVPQFFHEKSHGESFMLRDSLRFFITYISFRKWDPSLLSRLIRRSCWDFRALISSVLMTERYTVATMRRRIPIRLRRCLSITDMRF